MNKKGFSLIELIIVTIVVGVLAAAAIPIMRGYIKYSIKIEAITAMQVLRVSENIYYAKYGAYYWQPYEGANGNPDRFVPIGLRGSDLTGTYFSHHCYSVGSGGAIWCWSDFSTGEAPKAGEVNTKGWGMALFLNGVVNDHILNEDMPF